MQGWKREHAVYLDETCRMLRCGLAQAEMAVDPVEYLR